MKSPLGFAGLITALACAAQLGLSGLARAEVFAEWTADPSHPLLTGAGSATRALAAGYAAGRSDAGPTATWAFSAETPILSEGSTGAQAALYGFLEQTHSAGSDNFLVAALDAEGRIKIHSRSAAAGETVAIRGALGFLGRETKDFQGTGSLRLLADVTNNAKGSLIQYRLLMKSGDKWFLSELAFPGTTGEKDFPLGTTQWAEWDPGSAPAAPLPTAFSTPTSAIGTPDYIGLFFDGECSASGIGILISRIVVDSVP